MPHSKEHTEQQTVSKANVRLLINLDIDLHHKLMDYIQKNYRKNITIYKKNNTRLPLPRAMSKRQVVEQALESLFKSA